MRRHPCHITSKQTPGAVPKKWQMRANEEGVGLLEANISDDSGSENDSDYVGSQGEEESYQNSLVERIHKSRLSLRKMTNRVSGKSNTREIAARKIE